MPDQNLPVTEALMAAKLPGRVRGFDPDAGSHKLPSAATGRTNAAVLFHEADDPTLRRLRTMWPRRYGIWLLHWGRWRSKAKRMIALSIRRSLMTPQGDDRGALRQDPHV